MNEPVRIPDEQQPAVGEITVGQLNQLKQRSMAFDQIEVDHQRLRREYAQADRLRLIVQNETANYVKSLIDEHMGESADNYRIDANTGTIFQVTVTPRDESEEAAAEKEAMAAEAAAAEALGIDPTIDEAVAAALPEPHEYQSNRAPKQSDAQRCVAFINDENDRCGLAFDEIPGIHTDDTQPEPEE